jgi:hypothetical protein
MPHYHITIYGNDRAAMADLVLVRVHGVTVLRRTFAEHDDGYRVSAIADQDTIDGLAGVGYRVDRHEDVDEHAAASLAQVGTDNRFHVEASAVVTTSTSRRSRPCSRSRPARITPTSLS